jgi:4-amino-4-deoxychorismate lyase
VSVEHTVAHDDRGLAYGDGVFETMAATGGVVLALDRHLQRMASGCRHLGFEPPPMDTVRRASAAVVPCTGRCVIKLLVTRGRGGRGYRPPEAPEPTLRVSCHPWPQHVDLARRQGIVAWRLRYRLGHNPALAGLKHLNRLDQVLAAAELARHAQAQEGIVCDLEGRPVCGVMSNLFLVRDGALITPCLRRCGARAKRCAAAARDPRSGGTGTRRGG